MNVHSSAAQRLFWARALYELKSQNFGSGRKNAQGRAGFMKVRRGLTAKRAGDPSVSDR